MPSRQSAARPGPRSSPAWSRRLPTRSPWTAPSSPPSAGSGGTLADPPLDLPAPPSRSPDYEMLPKNGASRKQSTPGSRRGLGDTGAGRNTVSTRDPAVHPYRGRRYMGTETRIDESHLLPSGARESMHPRARAGASSIGAGPTAPSPPSVFHRRRCVRSLAPASPLRMRGPAISPSPPP